MKTIFKRYGQTLLRRLQTMRNDDNSASPSGISDLPTGAEAIIKSTIAELVTGLKTFMPPTMKKRAVNSLFANHRKILHLRLKSAVMGLAWKKVNPNLPKLPRECEDIIESTFAELYDHLRNLISVSCADEVKKDEVKKYKVKKDEVKKEKGNKDEGNNVKANNLLHTRREAKEIRNVTIKQEEQVLVKQAGFNEKFGPSKRNCRDIKNPCSHKNCSKDLTKSCAVVHFARSHLGLDPYRCNFDRRRCTFSSSGRQAVLKHIKLEHLAESDSYGEELQYLQLIPLSELKNT